MVEMPGENTPHWRKISDTDQSKRIPIGHVSAQRKLKTLRQDGTGWLIIWLKQMHWKLEAERSVSRYRNG